MKVKKMHSRNQQGQSQMRKLRDKPRLGIEDDPDFSGTVKKASHSKSVRIWPDI
jgi:hypothetical protein